MSPAPDVARFGSAAGEPPVSDQARADRQLHLSGAGVEVFVRTYAIEGDETQRDLLSDRITAQVLPS